jgi:hypothetical protein
MIDEDTPSNEVDSAKTASLLRAEEHIIRLTFWQTILSVVGIAVAVIALYAALTESAAVRQHTAAAVWPFVQVMIEDYDKGDAAGFSLALTNSGVGPAKMQDVRVTVDGNVTRNWSELVAIVEGNPEAAISRNFISNRVLRPDETVIIFGTTDAALARELIGAVSKPRGALTYCYCSIFDECWLADTRMELQTRERVDACPDFGSDAYVN